MFWKNFADQKKDVCLSLAAANIVKQSSRTSSIIFKKIGTGTGSGTGTKTETGTGTGTGTGTEAGIGTGMGMVTVLAPNISIKRWIRLARINIGLPSVTYTESG